MKMLEITGITYVCKQFNEIILNEATIKLHTGIVYGISSDGAAGVDAFIDILLGIKNPTQGNILFDGKNFSDINQDTYRKLIGCSLREDTLIHNYTGLENIMLAMEVTNIEEKYKKLYAYAILNRYEVKTNQANKLVNQLSVDERKVIEVVRAMVKNPDMLIIENLSKLKNEEISKKIFETLVEFAHTNGKCVILLDTTHQLENYADEFWGIQNGYLNYIYSKKKFEN